MDKKKKNKVYDFKFCDIISHVQYIVLHYLTDWLGHITGRKTTL